MKELIDIQRELRVPKERINKFSNYKYRSCEDILEAARPICNKNGCFLTVTDEIDELAGKLFVRATATLMNAEGQYVSTSASAEIPASQGGMSPSQLTGSASSYARKYALCGLFCLDDSKDPDAIEPKKVEKKVVAIDPSIVEEINMALSVDVLKKIQKKYPDLANSKAMKDLLNNRYKELNNGNTAKD